ncbi:MAG: hypothetical protein M1829_002299 [Trizodia sp. TS-e1964]|nr:MAG: hypothetical protein M1829_002299 [Trizodia sp. TS-e1964]
MSRNHRAPPSERGSYISPKPQGPPRRAQQPSEEQRRLTQEQIQSIDDSILTTTQDIARCIRLVDGLRAEMKRLEQAAQQLRERIAAARTHYLDVHSDESIDDWFALEFRLVRTRADCAREDLRAFTLKPQKQAEILQGEVKLAKLRAKRRELEKLLE